MQSAPADDTVAVRAGRADVAEDPEEKRKQPMTLLADTKRAPQHPLAGKTMSGADMIVQVLADEGVDAIFGYSGGAILPTYDAIFRYNEDCRTNGGREIQLVVPASEQGAGFMAAGYARSS